MVAFQSNQLHRERKKTDFIDTYMCVTFDL